MIKSACIVLFVGILILSSLVHAELIQNGGSLIYDTVQNITWYDYSYKGPQGSDATWSQSNSWATGLTVGQVTGWRLPRTTEGPYAWGTDGSTTAGYNITTSELGHLYYADLGNKGWLDVNGNRQAGFGLANTGPFTNLKPYLYWSGNTESSIAVADNWFFHTTYGVQDWIGAGNGGYALAVHSGDVLGNGIVLPNGPAVPVPGTIFLLAPGLVGLVWFGRRYMSLGG